jgi:hypothetical protein
MERIGAIGPGYPRSTRSAFGTPARTICATASLRCSSTKDGASFYVAGELGHAASLTTDTYGHVIEELEDPRRLEAEAAIRAGREAHVPASYPRAVEGLA